MLFSIPVANMKLAMTQSPLSSSARKGDIGKSPDARYEHKQPPGIWLHVECLVIEPGASGRDVEPIEIAAAEGAAGWPCDRHFHGFQPLSLGRIAAHAPAVPEGDPQTAFRIDGHSVGVALAFLELQENGALFH